MKFDTQTAAKYAGEKLDLLYERAARDTTEVFEASDIPTAVVYFDELRDVVRSLAEKVTALQKHVDTMSYDLIPTLFTNANVKSINVDGVGRVQINVRWSASMPDKAKGMQWLRSTGNDGLIIETVNSQTLGAWAKEQTMAGKPPPTEVFKVGTSNYVSVTKA